VKVCVIETRNLVGPSPLFIFPPHLFLSLRQEQPEPHLILNFLHYFIKTSYTKVFGHSSLQLDSPCSPCIFTTLRQNVERQEIERGWLWRRRRRRKGEGREKKRRLKSFCFGISIFLAARNTARSR
jgi:hypothetical protein